MVVKRFPPLTQADETGLLAIGGDLEVESLITAYSNGIFPWPLNPMYPVTWFSPPKRAILRLNKFHPSKSLSKLWRSGRYRFEVDKACPLVIKRCAKSTNRKMQSGTWITPSMISSYAALHYAGYCHSFECYEGRSMVGGLYGVSIGRMFAGESMFYEVPNASKLALHFLVDFLRERGGKWIDCQVMTPLFESFGAEEVDREEFVSLLLEEIDQPALFPVTLS